MVAGTDKVLVLEALVVVLELPLHQMEVEPAVRDMQVV